MRKVYQVRYYVATKYGVTTESEDYRWLWVAKLIRWSKSKASNILNPVIQVIG